MTVDGNELQFQVNHLSHFLMTLELLPIMKHTANNGDARIVIVTSKGNYTGKFDPKNLNGEISYGPIFNYQNSKLYIVSAFLFVKSMIIYDCSIDHERFCTSATIKRHWSNCSISGSRISW